MVHADRSRPGPNTLGSLNARLRALDGLQLNPLRGVPDALDGGWMTGAGGTA